MDLHQIFITHNRAWTRRELVFFLIFFGIAIVIAVCKVKANKVFRYQAVAFLTFLGYTAIVFASTVFTRNPGVRQYQLEVFWSWKNLLELWAYGQLWSIAGEQLFMEIFLNILLLLPLGMLLPVMWGRRLSWWQGLLIGCLISSSIETLQLVLGRGLFEFDDIIHNSIGCMVGCICSGYVFAKMQRWTRRRAGRALRPKISEKQNRQTRRYISH